MGVGASRLTCEEASKPLTDGVAILSWVWLRAVVRDSFLNGTALAHAIGDRPLQRRMWKGLLYASSGTQSLAYARQLPWGRLPSEGSGVTTAVPRERRL